MTVTEEAPAAGLGAGGTRRRRDGALARWRKARAVELAQQGLTYQQIADELGYAHRGTAHRVVTKALAERTATAVDDLRFLEEGRLDALQLAQWDKAMAGDVRAATTILRIIAQRMRLYGLDRPQRAAPATEQPRTVVVPPR